MNILKCDAALLWRYLIRLLVVLTLGVFSATSATIISQPPIWTPGNSVGNAAWDHIDGNGQGYQAFDDFRVDVPMTLVNVTWYGLFLDYELLDALPSATIGWNMEFFDDNNGVPGSRLSFTSLSSSLVGIRNVGSGSVGLISPVTIYQFTSNLNPFTVSPGIRYWFSAVSRGESQVPYGQNQQPFFNWIAGTGGDGASFSRTLPAGPTQNQQSIELDRAFSFNAVPEPSAFVPIATALVAFVGFRCSRRKSRETSR